MSPSIAIVGGGPSGLALAGMLERAGLDFMVYEREARDTPPRGGCLDLHIGSGQRAMKEAGCFEEMRKYGRLGATTVAQVWDHKGNKVFSWGEGRDAPEVDRYNIKKALLTTIPDEKVVWRAGVTEATRDEKGQVVLHLANGTTATGFKVVVGADGMWSKIRHLVCYLVFAMMQISNQEAIGYICHTKIFQVYVLDRQDPRVQPILLNYGEDGRRRSYGSHGKIHKDLEPAIGTRSLPA